MNRYDSCVRSWPMIYRAVAERAPDSIPPRSTAVPTETTQTAPTKRDRHIAIIAQQGRIGGA
jgi:hypothetical protein